MVRMHGAYRTAFGKQLRELFGLGVNYRLSKPLACSAATDKYYLLRLCTCKKVACRIGKMLYIVLCGGCIWLAQPCIGKWQTQGRAAFMLG